MPTDDELRAEVDALLASGENGEGIAIEFDFIAFTFNRWVSGALPNRAMDPDLWAAFQAGWAAYATHLKAD